MQEWHLENNQYEVLEMQNGDCVVKDKINNKFYYQKKYFVSKKWNFAHREKICWNWKDTVLLVSILISLISMVVVFIEYQTIYSPYTLFSRKEYIESVAFIIFNIVLHELAHYLVMRFYGRKAGKVKLKFYFKIFPCIVTNTTDSYMLPRYRRAFVYYAGIMTNWIVCGIVLLFFPKYSFLLISIVWMAIYNMIPFGGIRTDGYHIIVNTLLNVRDLKGKKNAISEIAKYCFAAFAVVSICQSILIMIGA